MNYSYNFAKLVGDQRCYYRNYEMYLGTYSDYICFTGNVVDLSKRKSKIESIKIDNYNFIFDEHRNEYLSGYQNIFIYDKLNANIHTLEEAYNKKMLNNKDLFDIFTNFYLNKMFSTGTPTNTRI